MPPIGFDSVPTATRIPFTFVEFNNSNAVTGAGLLEYTALMLGQKLGSGSAVPLRPVLVTSLAQAQSLFGLGSMLYQMCDRWFANNKSTDLKVIPLVDNPAGQAATGKLTFTGPATGAGAINLMIAGRVVSVAILQGDSATAIAAKVSSAINARADLGITSTAANGEVTLIYLHAGLVGNEVDVRVNYYDGQQLPAGVALTITPFAGGTLDPDLAGAIAAMGETWYNVIACPYNDGVALTPLENEMSSRFGPARQIDGIVIAAKNATLSALASFGVSRNSPHVSMQAMYKHPSAPHQYAAAVAAVVAYYANIDPARPFQTLQVQGELPALEQDRLRNDERNILLYDGISTSTVDAGGVLRLERLITMYRKTPLGADDVSYLDVTTMLTLSYIRYDFRSYMQRKYPRHKLGDDGGRYGQGQPVITPSVGRAEAIVKFQDWEELALVEDFDGFKANLIVERNVSNRNRLDFYLAPNLMNQLITMAAQIGFRL